MWNKEFELPDGSYSVSDMKAFFKYIIKKHKIVTNNPPIGIYVNKIETNITFRIEAGYYLKLLTLETMKLIGNTRSNITKYEMVNMYVI